MLINDNSSPSAAASPQASENWLVFSDDWGRHPSSCQYLISQLLPQLQVTWVNTIGMRTPKFDLATFRRVAGKIRSAVKHASDKAGPAEPNLDPGRAEIETVRPTVVSPLMWPWFTRAHDRKLNRWALRRRLKPIVESWTGPKLGITTIPIAADIMDDLPVDRWIYYCVDDFSVWPGLDQQTMLDMERQLVAKVDCIVSASEALQSRIADMGRPSELLTHGVNLQHWELERVEPYAWPEAIQGPVILFWGVIDQRLDVEFIIRLSESLTAGTIVLVGPSQNPDSRLAELKNVHLLPPVSVDSLPSMAKAAACLIMPYSDSPVTRAMQPLKLKEYLATRRPVVVRRLPATQEWSDACDLVSTPEQFLASVQCRLQEGISNYQLAARERLAEESWHSKAQHFREIISRSGANACV